LDDDVRITSAGAQFTIYHSGREFSVGLPADWFSFQHRNTALAIVAALLVEPSLDPMLVTQAVAAVSLPARFERFEECQRTIILDGAHNPDKVRATMRTVASLFPAIPCVGVVALKENKDIAAILAEIAPVCRSLILTTFMAGFWNPVPPGVLATSLRTLNYNGNVVIEPDPAAAVDIALAEAPTGGLVVVIGSFYLAGNVRSRWIPPLDDVLHGTSYHVAYTATDILARRVRSGSRQVPVEPDGRAVPAEERRPDTQPPQAKPSETTPPSAR
jgi:dihydrofolate synthase/folylpolyglutamate synthase